MNKELTIAQSSPLETKRAALALRRESLIQRFGDAARGKKDNRTRRLYEEIAGTNEFIETLDQIAVTMRPARSSGVPRFIVSSYFLHECFRKLTADKNEQFSFITGVELDGSFVLNQVLSLEHDKRTVLGVVANAGFTHRLLITLERFRHRLLAHFHSHPGNGPDSTHPSGTDESFQNRLEKAGHLAVAAIFSRDGFVRFFRMDRNFEVEVFGEGVEKHAPNIFGSPASIKLRAKGIAGSLARHEGIPGFDQERLSKAHVVCIGAGGLISNIAPALCRKGIGALTIFDDDSVEITNLNRQRFYPKDIGKNKAIALVRNLQAECTFATDLTGYPLRLEDASASDILPECDVAICGVDNNPARALASQFFRRERIPVIFTAVNTTGNYGYVFVQEISGPCLACMFPDIADDKHYPCPDTPAMADILQAAGALCLYAVDSLVSERSRFWNYRTVTLLEGGGDATCRIGRNLSCRWC